MKLGAIIRNAVLALFTLAVIVGLLVADWYLRHEPVRQARQYLARQEIPVEIDSAVSAAGDGRIFVLEQLKTAQVGLGKAGARGITPLQAAMRANEAQTVDFLLGEEAVRESLDHRSGQDGLTALGLALRKSDFGLANELVKLGADPNVELHEGTPLLLQACEDGVVPLFDFLLGAGADPDRTGDQPLSALAVAIRNQDADAMMKLLVAGADVTVNGESGESLVFEAVCAGDGDLADTLLAAGADPNQAGKDGRSLLTVAITAEDLVMLQLLLDRGADPNRSESGERSPLSRALSVKDLAAAHHLIQAGADAKQPELIRAAACERDVAALRLLLRAGADPETSGDDGVTILVAALEDGAIETTRSLLMAGADARGKLWPALRSGSDEMVRLVLNSGARVNEADEAGNSALDLALREDRDQVVAELLRRGANPNLKGATGESWLAAAIRTGNFELAGVLLDHGACIDGLTGKDGHSLLGWAIAWKQPELVERLVKLGADVRAREPAPASEAFRERFERSKSFRWHLQVDSKINPLMLAAAQGDHEIARVLIDAGANKNDYTGRYLWPVNIAAWHMDVPMMQIILGRDPDPDRQPRKLVINLSSQRVTLYKNGVPAYSSKVSTGKKGYRTKTGTFVISDKHRHHTSTIYTDAKMPYFMRLSCGDFGLHEGYVPSYPASHGCIRVPQSGAKHLFYACEVGDVVEIRY